ncbi:MAG: DUF2269 family protein [Cyanobacteriota bacterium]
MKISKVSKISLLNGIVLVFLTLLEFLDILKYNLIFSYNTHKILHITGVVLFMGNMIVGPFWFLFAYYSKDKSILRFANKVLQLTDICFTIPGIFITIINGLCLASVFGGTKNQPWLFYSIILLFIMSGLSIPLIYIQEKLYNVIENESANEEKINKWLVIWGIIGTIVTIPATIIFYLMITKNI